MSFSSVLIRDPEIVKQEFHTTVGRLYNPLLDDAQEYRRFARDHSIPLDQSTIRKLVDRLGQAKHRTHTLLSHLKEHAGSLYELSESHLNDIVASAWMFQISTERAVEEVLRYTSVRMEYFPKTFQKLESVDPYRIDKLSSQERGEILEIAGEERDAGIQRERPRLMKIAHDHIYHTKRLVIETLKTESLWNVKWFPLYEWGWKDESEVDHPAISPELDGTRPNPHTARLGKIAFDMALLRLQTSDRVYSVLQNFLFEESELISRLKVWFGMPKQYRPADISEWTNPTRDSLSDRNT